MRLNTIIKLPDGRIGTTCWYYWDGDGGVWGKHHFKMPKSGFGDLPHPEFMLREPEAKDILVELGHRPDVECVGTEYEIIQKGDNG